MHDVGLEHALPGRATYAGHMSLATVLTDLRCASMGVCNRPTAAPSYPSGTRFTPATDLSVRMLAYVPFLQTLLTDSQVVNDFGYAP